MSISDKYDIIRSQIITEKSNDCGALGKYVFRVLPRTNKSLVKSAIEEIFDVKVTSVHVLNIRGKVKKFKGIIGRRANYKKAIVTLQHGQTIDISGGIR